MIGAMMAKRRRDVDRGRGQKSGDQLGAHRCAPSGRTGGGVRFAGVGGRDAAAEGLLGVSDR